jgi:hypothetical protein
MGLLKEAFPTWKDKLALFGGTLALAILVVLLANAPRNESTDFNEHESRDIITKWEDEVNSCYIILDKETGKALNLSCLPKTKE